MIIGICVIFLLLICSAFLSSSEAAFLCLSETKIHQLKKQHPKKANAVLALRDNMDNVLSFVLLFNNLVNIMAAALATNIFIKQLGESGIFWATATISVLVVMFTELLPKMLALRYPESIAMAFGRLLYVLVMATYPVSSALDKFGRYILNFIPGYDKRKKNQYTHKDLKALIDNRFAGNGQVNVTMLKNTMDLAGAQVGDIMVHRKKVFMIDGSLPTQTIIALVKDSQFTRIPIWLDNPDNIIGLLHAKKLFKAVYDKQEIDTMQLIKKPWFIPESTSLLVQLQNFRKRKEHCAMVIDEYGTFQGIVTLEDILEEIVGEINDEYDKNERYKVNILSAINNTSSAPLIVDASTNLRDINKRFTVELPDDDCSTISGLILYETRGNPVTGAILHMHNLKIKILRKNKHEIVLVQISKMHY